MSNLRPAARRIVATPVVTKSSIYSPVASSYAATRAPSISAYIKPAASPVVSIQAKPALNLGSAYAQATPIVAAVSKPRFDQASTVAQLGPTPSLASPAARAPAVDRGVPAPATSIPDIPRPAEAPYSDNTDWEEFKEPEAPRSAPEKARDDELVKAANPTLTAKVELPKIVQRSWFDKLLSVFGLSRKGVQGAQMAGEAADMAGMTQTEAAHTLVRRSRNGDQNAMAIIALVRDNAKAGNLQAILTAKIMKQYIDTHPVTADTLDMGYDDMVPAPAASPHADTTKATAIRLAQGPKLDTARVTGFLRAAGFGAEEVSSFKHGYAGRPMRNPDPRIQRANKFGAMVSHARKLQEIQAGGSVSKFDPMIGWELGEDE